MIDAPAIPFNALHAVLMAARYGALGPAAGALGVTPGAVSQHIRRAEARAGTLLFTRTPSGLVPTPALAAILPDLETGFSALRRIEERLAGPGRDTVLTVTVANVFASRWLVWRLPRFAERHGEIELRLIASGTLLDLARPDIDCAIRYGAGIWPGVDALPLGPRTVFPVCAPALAERLTAPAMLTQVPVIADGGTLRWEPWLRAAGVPDLRLSGPVYSDPALAFDAAISGQGVLLVMAVMAEYALANGQLVRPFAQAIEEKSGYWFATAKASQLPARTRKFRDWLFAEMAGSGGMEENRT